jgi:hypothetical protein
MENNKKRNEMMNVQQVPKEQEPSVQRRRRERECKLALDLSLVQFLQLSTINYSRLWRRK